MIDPIEIKAYLAQTMPPSERKAFESRLVNDAALRSAVEDYRPLFDGLEQLQWLERQKQVAQWSKQAAPEVLEAELIDQEIINLYYSGELDEALKTNFKDRLKEEPEFAQKLADYQPVFEAMNLLQRQEIEEKVRKLSSQKDNTIFDQPTQSKPEKEAVPVASSAKRRRLIPLGIAAALTAALVFGWLGGWLSPSDNNSLEAFLSEHYEAPINLAERSGEAVISQKEGPFVEGIKAYHANLLQESIEAFEGVGQDNQKYLESQYYIAHAWYQLKDYQKSGEAFSRVSAGFSNRSYSQKGIGNKNGIEWNRILAFSRSYLEQDQRASRQELDQLLSQFISQQKEGSPYHQDAMELKEALESFN